MYSLILLLDCLIILTYSLVCFQLPNLIDVQPNPAVRLANLLTYIQPDPVVRLANLIDVQPDPADRLPNFIDVQPDPAIRLPNLI
jgi:hypothetical protein